MTRLAVLFFLIFIGKTGFSQSEDTAAATMSFKSVCLLVTDYDEAVKFYTEKLDFKVTMDRKYGENQRWVTLAFPDNSCIELSLGLATTEEDKKHIGKQSGHYPLFVILTNNFDNKYENLKSRGADFLSEPTTSPWGKGVTLKDLYGNLIYLREK